MTDSAAIYARVSTAQQEDGTSLDTQIAACLALAEEGGWQVEQPHVFREQSSGADQERLLLTQVRRLARLGVVKAVIVHSPDRLSRDPLHLMVMTEEFTEAWVKLLFVQGPSGTTAEDKLVRYILGYVGEKEREFITERTMRGKKSTAQNGRMPVGTGKGLYGYQYDPTTKQRTILHTEAAAVKKAFAWASQGISLYQNCNTPQRPRHPNQERKRMASLDRKADADQLVIYGLGLLRQDQDTEDAGWR